MTEQPPLGAWMTDPGMHVSRRALLDALDALDAQRDALIVVGAQAVFEHTSQLIELPGTSTLDADLAIDPTLLATVPLVELAMANAGFTPASQDRPGIYVAASSGATVDLLVPERVAGVGTRGARIPPHSKRAATRADGLELALLDWERMEIRALEPTDPRVVTVKVAGVAALLCAKSYKLGERIAAAADGRGRGDRVRPKDAGDVLRLMVVSDAAKIAATFEHHTLHPTFGESVRVGRNHLRQVFGPGGRGLDLAAASEDGVMDAAMVRMLITDWMTAFA